MRKLIAALAAVVLFGHGNPVVAQAQADAKPRIAILSAFAPEWAALKAQTEIERSQVINGVEFVSGKLAGRDVVLFLSGISMVNAAMTTQLAFDRFTISHLVISGIAGGVDPQLQIGDVAVAARWAQYQEMLFARETAQGFKAPAFLKTPHANYGYMFPQNVRVRSEAQPGGEEKFWFDADAQLLDIARRAATRVTLKRCATPDKCLSAAPRVLVGGNGVSGATFVDNAKFREWTFATFQAQVLDMETAAAAMVAYANGKPFIAFRSLSDLAGGGPGENEIGTFFQLAADNSAAMVVAFLTAWQ